MKSAAVYLSAFAILLFSFPASAQWPENGSPACAAPYDKVNPKIAGDGLGNAFLTWSEWPPVLDSPHHRIQKVNAGGVLWSDCGVLACTVNIHGFYPSIAADGAGGAIAVWVDSRGIGTPIYAQRIDADGSLLWASEAVQACGPEGYKWWPRLCSDGSGGAIIVWSDNRAGRYDVYAQRIDAAGTVIWPQDGVALCSADGDQGEAYLVPDGAGGAIVMWTDARGDEYDIFAQRIDANGTILWAADGIPVCSASGPQIMACMVSDGAGGAIIAWDDGRTQVPAGDIFAQRIAGNGSLLWPAEGVGVCVAPSTQNGCRIASDGAGGAIVIWMDNRSPGQGIYAQRIDANGALQ